MSDALERAGIPRDPVIEAFKKDVDRTLIRESLKLTPGQRIHRLQVVVRQLAEMRAAMKRAQK